MEESVIYKVIMNEEEQYSIWPILRETPVGWRDVGKEGLKDECLNYISTVWTDIRPLGLNNKKQ